VLRVVYLSATGFKRTGKLATVVFTKKGSLSARPPKLESEVFSDAGAQTAVQPIVSQPAGTGVGTSSTVGTSGATLENQINKNADTMGNLPGRPSIATSTSSDPITNQSAASDMSQENRFQHDETLKDPLQETPYNKSQSGTPVIEPVAVLPAGAGVTGKVVPSITSEVLLKNLKSFESVAERFRTYKGARTLKGFSELFADSKSKVSGLIQTPKIAVSDGITLINLKVLLTADSGVPSFSLRGANLKNIKNLSDGFLELDALPQGGKLDVRISMVIQKEVADIPLLVVPPVPVGFLELTDSDLEKLLSIMDLKNKTLPYDLNADGKQDYLDDYILVAHWLLKQQRDKKIPAAKPAVPRK
jgi:hypothetical protein